MMKNELKELRIAAAIAELNLSKVTAAAYDAASKYCKCTHKVYKASNKYADENPNDGTIYTREADWDDYQDAVQVSSDTKDIAQRTVVIARDEYKWDQ